MNHYAESGKFAYQRVRSAIETMLTHGELAVGDRLPPIRELAVRFGCNYHTVRKGLESLINDSLLESRTGSGVFVRAGSRTLSTPIPPGAESVLAVICHPPMLPNDSQFIASLHEQAEKRNLNLELHTVTSFSRPERIFDRIAVRGCLAVLLPLLRSDDNLDEIAGCIDRYRMPFVVGTPFPGLEAYCYESPEIFGVSAGRAVEAEFLYFRELGFHNIVLLLPGDEAVRTVSFEISPYVRRCAEAGIPIRLSVAERRSDALDRFFSGVEELRGDLAVICYDDEIASRLIDAARRRNWRIPDEIALIGLGDTSLATATNPALSSVVFPYDYVTGSMIDCALALAAGNSAQRDTPIWQPIIIRESCGGARRVGRENAAAIMERIRLQLQQENGAIK